MGRLPAVRFLWWKPKASEVGLRASQGASASANMDPATGLPRDLLTASTMPESLKPEVDPAKTRVFEDEIDNG